MELTFDYLRYEATGLLIAECNEHPGIMVHGRTLAELESRIPEAVKAVFAAEGKKVDVVARMSMLRVE